MGRFLPLILKNCWRNHRRTLLTVFSIGVSLCLLGVVMALYKAFYFAKPNDSQALRLITRNRVSLALPMPIFYGPKIAQIHGVREVMMSQWFGGTYKDARDPNNFFARLGVEQEKLFTVVGEMVIPEDQKNAFLHDRTGCILGKNLAQRLKLKVGDRITIVGDIFPLNLDMTIRGLLEMPQDDSVLYFHWKYLEESIPLARRSNISTFSILADSIDDSPRVAKAVDDMFHNSPFETKTESELQFNLSFLAFLGNVKVFLLSICGAVVFSILLVSANTMAMSVRERSREVGILKTIGFTTSQVLGVILGEAVLISEAGAVLGLLLAMLLCAGVSKAVPMFQGLKIQPVIVAVSLVLAAVIGVASSFVPALGAAKTPIIEAIRDSG
ncbi:MAG TPA: FtsX-like permease family protein [Bryobacteraceae bacterium]|nr:FtsX-like permease family protein [Bryobacteraceae bacterium]